MKALTTLLKADPEQVYGLSIQQVIALCGNGKLTDASDSSIQFRAYLSDAPSEVLCSYVETCLSSGFDQSGRVLQDVINELGRRLDYAVENGLYQGKSNAIGFDGIWVDESGHALVVEVKTTDAYRINLDTLAGYREELIVSSHIGKKSSCLIVVGRQDTGDLEAQVRGSKHAWTIRIISADALMKLVLLKEKTEEESVAKMHELMIPVEYTKLDKIIEIAFKVAEDASTPVEEEVVQPTAEAGAPTAGGPQKQEHTASDVLDAIRQAVFTAMSKKQVPLIKKSRALYWSADKKVRAAITISKQYESGGYWYAYHKEWDKFLGEGDEGFYVLGCVGRAEAYALPFKWLHERLQHLHTTVRGDKVYWHVHLEKQSGKLVLRLHKAKKSETIGAFAVPLGKAAAANP